MTNLFTILLLLFLGRTPHHLDDETWLERSARMEIISSAIVKATDRATCYNKKDCKKIWSKSRKELAFILATTAILESTLSQHVHENRCNLKIGECDAVKTINNKGRYVYIQKAFSPWQLQYYKDIPKNEWLKIKEGVPGTDTAAWHAARRMSSALASCKTIEGAISRYAKGHSCEWAESGYRYGIIKSFMSYSLDKLKDKKRIQKEKR